MIYFSNKEWFRVSENYFHLTVIFHRKVLFLGAVTTFVSLLLYWNISGMWHAHDPQENAVLLTYTRKTKEQYVIHIWEHGEDVDERFLRSDDKDERDPFEFCSVRNCDLTTNNSLVDQADAVVFFLHRAKLSDTLPKVHPPGQLWIFFADESPLNMCLQPKGNTLKNYNGLFNWSMTYRRDSDVHVPYGRTVPLSKEDEKLYKDKDFSQNKALGVAILVSNCWAGNRRLDYVQELQKYLRVDVYGKCGTLECPGHYYLGCPLIDKYKFYLAFENSNCAEYITEKVWWNAYHKETVPVVMGAPKSDYVRLCPPNSFIHVDDFESPAKLARYLSYLLNNDTAYNSFFEWKKKYKVLNEHGFLGSKSAHLCRICEALNETPAPVKIYTDLSSFWNPESDCRPPSWIPRAKLSLFPSIDFWFS